MTWVWLDEPPTDVGVYDYAGRGGFGELVVWRSTAADGVELQWAVMGPSGLVASGACPTWDDDWAAVGLEGQARGVRWGEPRRELPPAPDGVDCSQAGSWRSSPMERAPCVHDIILEADGAEVARERRGAAAGCDMRLTILADVARVWAYRGCAIDGDELVVRIVAVEEDGGGRR